MCGIAGVLTHPSGDDLDLRVVARDLGRALAHRGPDGEGAYVSPAGRCALVHRRLAIIDLSDAGAQPMATPDGRYSIVFNGEIYNHRHLRRELEADGERFRSASDTEVLLRLLVRRGPSALPALRGMFALALWDEAEQSLLVARDGFGIKPLYVTASSTRIAFASEIRALRIAGLVAPRVSPAGVLAYLAWGSVPCPLTWIEGVEQLPPGTWRRWDRGGAVSRGTFADIRAAYVAASAARLTEADLRERVRDAVLDSVRAHLVADVPVGILLSGGIDSSSLVSATRTVTSGEVRTYTVAFDEQAYTEEGVARSVAEAFETTHGVIRVGASAVAADLPAIVDHLDQPSADAVNSYYISRAVAATGLKAVLSGTGGDELFGGYPSFRRIPRARRLQRWLGPALRATGPAIGWRLGAWRLAKWNHVASGPRETAEVYRAQRGLFMPAEWPEILGPMFDEPGVLESARAALAAAEADMLSPSGEEGPLAAVARLETRGYLGSQLLRDIDIMSMAHSLEVRVPFVDGDLLRATWPALDAHPGLARNKRVLFETLARPLPAASYDRPKRGFTFPFEDWMRGGLGAVVREGLEAAATEGWIARHVPETLWTSWKSGEAHWSRPWALGILGLLLKATPRHPSRPPSPVSVPALPARATGREMRTLLLLPGAFGPAGGLEMYDRLLVKAFAEIAQQSGGACETLILNDREQDIDSRYLRPRSALPRVFARSKSRFVASAIERTLRFRPDLVLFGHVNFGRLALLVRRLRPAAAQWFVTYGIDAWRRLRFLDRRALRAAQRILAISDYTRRRAMEENDLDPARLELLPCAVDPFWMDRVGRAASRFGANANGGAPVLLTVARLDGSERYKGIDHVLAALPAVVSRIPGIRYVVVGDGDDRPRLEALARDLGLGPRVEFRGRVSPEELARAYGECSLFVMPSAKEGFGIVYLEAALLGKPSIAADRGGAPEVVIDGETGRVVRFGDVGALAEAIATLLCDSGRLKTQGERARARVHAHFTYERFAARLKELVHEGSGEPEVSIRAGGRAPRQDPGAVASGSGPSPHPAARAIEGGGSGPIFGP